MDYKETLYLDHLVLASSLVFVLFWSFVGVRASLCVL